MIDRKLKIYVAMFAYGGNGGVASIVPQIANWMAWFAKAATLDSRIQEVIIPPAECDTPIPMVRNNVVCKAREAGADVLLMIDSDMIPDCETGAPNFWDTSFDFLFKHYEKGPCVIGAPYGGPPPYENIYVFRWTNTMNDAPDRNFSLSQYGREEAATLTGITPVGALPTGFILYDMRAFELTQPNSKDDKPWFYYEYTDHFERAKGSTEDVTATRNMSVAGIKQLGYNPLYCNWDCWAGHVKPKVVRKPQPIYVDYAAKQISRSAKSGISVGEAVMDMGGGKSLSDEQVQELNAAARTGDPRALCIPVGRPGTKDSHRELVRTVLEAFRTCSMMSDAERVELLNLCKRAKKIAGRYGEAVEVGSWIGIGSNIIASAFSDNGRLFCVDTWEGSATDATGGMAQSAFGLLYDAFLLNTEKYTNIVPKRMPSVTFAEEYQGPADFILIDADHAYEACLADLRVWWPKLKVGGIMAVHDFDSPLGFVGVDRAVREFFGELGIWNDKLAQQKTDTLWWIKKPSAVQAKEDETNGEYLSTCNA